MQNILYTRVSTGNQGSQSLNAQNQICLNFLNSNGITLTASFQEIGSAYSGNQTVLKYVIDTCKNSNLYVLNVSRFSRNILVGVELLKKATTNNINVHFIEDQLSSMNKTHAHQIRVKLSESQHESEIISNRINNINNILLDKGWQFGVAEYGKKSEIINGVRKFNNSSKEKSIIDFICQARNGVSCRLLNTKLRKIEPKADPIYFYDSDGITKINYFDRSQTLTFQEIADLLNDYDIKKRGKDWTASSVNNVYNSYYLVDNRLSKMDIGV